MNITLKNCNNIDFASINLIEGRLNIKYAINGTGKSTIAKSLELYANTEDLKVLTPYKYLLIENNTTTNCPEVVTIPEIKRVSVFNEESINQYIFLPDDLLANSFEILIKTPDYEERMNNIQILIQSIQETFINNPELDSLISDLSTFISGFGNAKSGYSVTGSIGKGIAKGNKIANIPADLVAFTPFIKSQSIATWLSWQSKGNQYLDIDSKCPYCTAELEDSKKSLVKKVADEYDSKYITELQKMIGIFQTLREYMTDTTKNVLDRLATSIEALNQEEINFLKEIKSQVIILNEKLVEMKTLNFGTLKDVDAVLDALHSKKIDLSMLSHINSEHSNSKVSIINSALDEVITKAGQLQGEINQQKILIQRTVEKYHDEINGFLESAGYNYKVSIIEDQVNNTYKMILMSNESLKQVEDVKLRLSFGERNAFALVLFMYRAIKEDPDLIILDDPISSFDKNKKYAIMEMLFQGNGTFQGKTVMMLTHDFDPIVDLIYTASIRCRFNPIPVASFLGNENGTIIEKEIKPSNIYSFFEIANININSNIDEINKLIYLRRRLEAVGDKGLAWQLLSNIFHPFRETPKIQNEDGYREMTTTEIDEASKTIRNEIPNFEYHRIYQRTQDKKQMIELYNAVESGYEKIQLFRIINYGQISDTIFKKFVDEAYHIENDSLFQLNPTEYPLIPEYILNLCDRSISEMSD